MKDGPGGSHSAPQNPQKSEKNFSPKQICKKVLFDETMLHCWLQKRLKSMVFEKISKLEVVAAPKGPED